jgi:ADP-ribosyl-[dinitrogen reductase] hydrolase
MQSFIYKCSIKTLGITMNVTELSRIEGAILGFAIGDSLGMANEYKANSNKITDFQPHPANGLKPGQWTDDTQIMLCVLDSIISNRKIQLEDVAKRLSGWYTSGNARSIGHTTRQALERLISGVNYRKSGETGDRSAGNGALPRVLPYSLFYAKNDQPPRYELRNILKITHGHKDVYQVGKMLDYSVRSLINGHQPQAVIDGLHEYENKKSKRKFAEMLSGINDLYPEQFIEQRIGNGGHSVSTFMSAMYCFLKTPNDFKTAVLTAVNSGGDTDSRGALTGALCGAYNGVSGIPEKWVAQVEESAALQAKAKRLYGVANGHAA